MLPTEKIAVDPERKAVSSSFLKMNKMECLHKGMGRGWGEELLTKCL